LAGFGACPCRNCPRQSDKPISSDLILPQTQAIFLTVPRTDFESKGRGFKSLRGAAHGQLNYSHDITFAEEERNKSNADVERDAEKHRSIHRGISCEYKEILGKNRAWNTWRLRSGWLFGKNPAIHNHDNDLPAGNGKRRTISDPPENNDSTGMEDEMESKRKQILFGQKVFYEQKLKDRLSFLSEKGIESPKAAKDTLVRKFEARVRAVGRRLKTIAKNEKRTEEMAKVKADRAAAPKKDQEGGKGEKPKKAPEEGKGKKAKAEKKGSLG
jgi:hypothetical protein